MSLLDVGSSPTSPKISFVMPAYNEEKNIEQAVRRLLRFAETSGISDYEVVIVDDGSVDGTREKALKLSDGARIKVIGYARNLGKGSAIKYGVEHASGVTIFFIDSDLDIRASELRAYTSALGDCDLAIGSKRHPKSKVRAPALRRVLSFGFNVLVSLLVGAGVSDTQSGLKAGRASSLKRIFKLLSVRKYAYDVEMLAVAQLLRCRVKELPVEIEIENRFKMADILRMVIDVLGVAYRLRIRRWYQKNLDNEQPRYRPIVRW